MVPGGRCWIALAARLSAAAGLLTMTAALGAGPTYSVGPISDLSGSCSGQNAEVEQTVDPSHAGQGRSMVSSRGGINRLRRNLSAGELSVAARSKLMGR